ncbi:MAG: hypothetical protein ACHQZQ_06430 [SAR324 cluster bacterium]
MVANARLPRLRRGREHPAVPSLNRRQTLSYALGVRMKFGDELEGLELLPDGLVFRAPAPLLPGKMVELILCRGSLLVDAMVVHCAPLDDEAGGFAVHTRFHHVSDALGLLIREEVARHTGRPNLLDP